jgi:toxin ParE1/3/4
MKVIWSKRAVGDLGHIRHYVFLNNPRAAAPTADRIEAATDRLRRFPNSGRPSEIAGAREIIVPGLPYVVIYRVSTQNVEILRVFHTSRDWPELMQ